MASKSLRAVVIGAGWAGEGHTKALQACGVEVVAICAREAAVVQAVADRLQVPVASVDWRKTLQDVQPEIVALTTPASLRQEVIEEAVKLGCHLLCEKPLATDAATAAHLYTLVKQAGVKHAFGATHCYDPSIAWLAELIQGGEIGNLREIHCLQLTPYLLEYTPWSWMDSKELGGGALNNGATHLFAMLERITGGKLIRATGTALTLRHKAPVLPNLHDYRQIFTERPSATDAAALDWRPCDADHAFSALLQCTTGTGNAHDIVQLAVHVNLVVPFPAPTNGWYCYGDKGTLVGQGAFSLRVAKQGEDGMVDLPIPQRLIEAIPQVGNTMQGKWNALAADFVADIQHNTGKAYPNFNDGWRYQAAIEAIRGGQHWVDLPV